MDFDGCGSFPTFLYLQFLLFNFGEQFGFKCHFFHGATKLAFEERLASMWLADMPQAAIDIVQNKRLSPAVAIIKLENDVTRPSFQEIEFMIDLLMLRISCIGKARLEEFPSKGRLGVMVSNLGSGTL